MNKKVRVRFAPSPTGGLHIGGVRTVLFNYLFAKQHGGDFVLRIEDTDQNRFIEGAEDYIYETLNWCGLQPDESPVKGGEYGPYRQSERKQIYEQYARRLVENGFAYYAFDTPAELDEMRVRFKTTENPNPHYNYVLREEMKNSLSLGMEQTNELLNKKTPYVVRIKMPVNEEISFKDLIRGEVSFNSSQVDDKVLLKADGMPTYHLAVVVDDYSMKITHAFRGEEWLPSAPVHVLLWKYFGWIDDMPQWAHLPLILKPDGHGKLSKRDGDRLGFPVFAMNWTEPRTNEIIHGFREKGFLPEAFINMLAMLGWNDGTDQEIFSLPELVEKFSLERVHKGGAKLDYEKAKWFNHEWINKLDVNLWMLDVRKTFEKNNIEIHNDEKLKIVLELVKERCTLLTDFLEQASFFFKQPEKINIPVIQPKWNKNKTLFFDELIRVYKILKVWHHDELETSFKELVEKHQLKAGELLLPFRIMLVGDKFGPGVFDIAAILEKDETINRIRNILQLMHA